MTFSGATETADAEVGREHSPRPTLDAVPFETKLRAPTDRVGLVERPRLEGRLDEAVEAVVLVSAPAGFGKTTLGARWVGRAAAAGRRVAWLSLSESDNDPAVLRTYFAHALDALWPVEGRFADLATSQADLASVLLPRLGRAYAAIGAPSVLVLDDVHVLRSAASLSILRVLTAHVPPGSHLVLLGRRDPELPVSRMLAQGQLLRLDRADLAMSPAEAEALLVAAGVPADHRRSEEVVERADGWPAGIYLAALALRDGADAVTGSIGESSMAGYLHDEVLTRLASDEVEFLVSTSVLPRLSGPLCDAVLARGNSAARLADLERRNLFVIPLDADGAWFRYHHAFQATLLGELRRRAPEQEPELRRRASAWFAERGLHDDAVQQALGAGDLARFDELVWTVAPALLGSGRNGTVERWLEPLSREEIEARPALAVTAAWSALTIGETEAIDGWLAAAERADEAAQLPDGTPVAAAVALLRALVARNGAARARDDAATSFRLDRPASLYRAISSLIDGSTRLVLGDRTGARERLHTSVHIAGELLPSTRAIGLAELALLAIEDDDWMEAARLSRRGMSANESNSLHERPAQVTVFAVAALVAAHDGNAGEARRCAKHAVFLLDMLVGISPWQALQARCVLADATLRLGDVDLARALLDEADRMIARDPDPGRLADDAARLRSRLESASVPLGASVTPLTQAEMRVLRYLPTHLSFGEIAAELFVSRNTVKTQAIAIYRKLGVSSRSAAVQVARDMGIVED